MNKTKWLLTGLLAMAAFGAAVPLLRGLEDKAAVRQFHQDAAAQVDDLQQASSAA